jgi:hypothetical protein
VSEAGRFEEIEAIGERALAAARDADSRWAGGEIFTHEAYDKDRELRPMAPVEDEEA